MPNFEAFALLNWKRTEWSKASMVNVLGLRWRFWITVAIALLLITLSGCATATSSPEQTQHRQSSHTLEFVPKQSLFAAVLETDIRPGQLWQRSTLPEQLFRLGDSLLSPLAIDFNDDIRPWLGHEVAFVVTDKDLDRDRLNGRQAGYLLVADIADGERLREFLELLWQRQSVLGNRPILTEVSGVPIIAGTVTQGTQPLATAVIGGNTLLVANDVKVLQQSLRVTQAQGLQLLGRDCCSAAWVNLQVPDLLDWLGVATPEKLTLISALRWQQLQAAIDLDSQQITINTVLTGGNSSALQLDVPNHVSKTTKTLSLDGPGRYVSEDVAWAVMGDDLSSLWTAVQHELQHYQRLPSVVQQQQQWLSTQLAQSLTQSLTQLLADDYAIAQLEDGTWLMAASNTNPMTVEQLDSLAIAQGLTVSQLTLKGNLVTVWSRLKTHVDARNRETTVETELVGVHTKVDDCQIFSTSIAGLTTALAAPAQRLSTNRQFQRALQPMDKLNHGYVYGTWPKLDRLLASNRWFSLVKPILQPWSQAIDAIAITSYGQTANQSTGAVSILLKN